MHGTIQTSGHVLRGLQARFYDLGNAFYGVPLINLCHAGIVRLTPGDRLLDIGCGTGRVLGTLRRRFGNRVSLHGIDPSPDMVSIARRRFRRCATVRIRPGVGESLAFPDDSFDWIVSCLTTHHLPRPLKRAMVAECYRVLRPGGRLLLTDFGRPTNRLGRIFARKWKDHSHAAANLAGAVPRMVRRAGFEETGVRVQGGVILHLLAQKPHAAPRQPMTERMVAHV